MLDLTSKYVYLGSESLQRYMITVTGIMIQMLGRYTKMKLENIGFYTLNDARAKNASVSSPLWRAELILTGRCNFKCPYCRSVGGIDLSVEEAERTICLWVEQGLKNIRFSGGEPTLYKGLGDLVSLAKLGGVTQIAISTNGATGFNVYKDLIERGVTDFSISLDAANAEDGDMMAGKRPGAWNKVVANIKALSKLVYVTVGVVLTADNTGKTEDIVRFADTLGVSDIRVIPAAQHGTTLPPLKLEERLLTKYPILRYRFDNLARGRSVRGLDPDDTHQCGLVMDDMAAMGGEHYPCIIYMREGGNPIGKIGPNMRAERAKWSIEHDCHKDKICAGNCLDVCRDYNNKWIAAHRGE
jgi:MoaA/NifB/PqqE/SkfB family radical SAM enzyme